MNISFSPPDISGLEIDEVAKALRSGWITTGARTKDFERKIAEYIGAPRAVCLSSATAALETTLRIFGIGEGDEVITTAYTYTASASVIAHVGAKIVLCDTYPDSFEMNYERMAELITERTKAVIPVDIGGKLCCYDKIFSAVSSKKALFKPDTELQKLFSRAVVIADSAHGFGAQKNGLKSGSFADFTVFSFHAVKNLTTGEGGAVVWKSREELDDDMLYKEYMLYSLHGQSKDAFSKDKPGAWEYDIIHLGYKCNMTDIAAAIGLKQLERYGDMLARRKELINRYDRAFLRGGVVSLEHFPDSDSSSSGHLYMLRILKADECGRNAVIERLAEKGIAANVHYKPLPMLTAYRKLGFDISDFPNAYGLYKNEISLPLNTVLTDEQADYIIETVSGELKKF